MSSESLQQDENEAVAPASSRLPRPIDGRAEQPVVRDRRRSRMNFLRLVAYYVLIRTGWIFKTESIMMPAVIDLIGGAGWLRGCLPMLNRLGQSLPPLLVSDWLRNRRIKKWGLVAATSTMGVCFLLLSLLWWWTGGERSAWLPFVFLVIYAIFFSATGINNLIGSTLTGKLVAVRKRGRLILASTTLGAISGAICAWYLLRIWLSRETGQFGLIFLVTGACFVAAALIGTRLQESEDEPTGTRRNSWDLLQMSWRTLVDDRNFRRLAVIAGLMGMSMTLFPHYQNVARGQLDLGLTALIPWLIAQNLGAAFFSWPTGWLGDRVGYRAVLRMLMLLLCIAPLITIVLAQHPGLGKGWFLAVFTLLGLTPVTMKAFSNYTLEIVEPKYHPRYLSTIGMCMAAPAILTSTLLGALGDLAGFEFVFGLVTALLFAGWMLTFRLAEPRHS